MMTPHQASRKAVHDAAAAPFIGQVVLGYQLVREVGRGGMGIVFEGVQKTTGQRAALKILLAELLDNPEYVERFQREARAAAAVQHPGLVKVLGAGVTPDGYPCMAMEFLAGESLHEYHQRALRTGQRLSSSAVIAMGRQVAAALTAVHEQGITHRDLKPANIIVSPLSSSDAELQLRIVDFGLAKLDSGSDADAAALRQTTEGKFLGTVLYASPEQCRADGSVGPPADVYSLGVILYELLADRPPFVGSSGAVLGMQMFMPPQPLRELAPRCPVELQALIHHMLDKEPAGRPAMPQVAQRLQRLAVAAPLAASGARQRRILWLGVSAAVLFLAIGALVGGHLGRRDRAGAATTRLPASRVGTPAAVGPDPALPLPTAPLRPGPAVDTGSAAVAQSPAPRKDRSELVGPGAHQPAAQRLRGIRPRHRLLSASATLNPPAGTPTTATAAAPAEPAVPTPPPAVLTKSPLIEQTTESANKARRVSREFQPVR